MANCRNSHVITFSYGSFAFIIYTIRVNSRGESRKGFQVLLTKMQLEAFGSHPSKCSLSVQVRVYKCICVSCLYSHICRTITL